MQVSRGGNDVVQKNEVSDTLASVKVIDLQIDPPPPPIALL